MGGGKQRLSAFEETDIEIVFEDNHLLCAVKPVGVLSQGDGSGSPDMLTLLKEYIKKKYGKPGDVYLGLVHRLDRPVGGIMVFGRTSKAASRLSEQIRNRTFKKTYYAVLRGELPEDSGLLRNIIIKDHRVNTVKTLPYEDLRGGKGSNVNGGGGASVNEDVGVAELEFRKVDVVDNMTLVIINLVTGRPHQIRAQFSYHGYPVLGDRKYKGYARTDISGPALWAHRIEFNHPVTKGIMTIKADMPDRYPWTLFNVRKLADTEYS